jgi:hypothetical protein
MGKKQMKNTLDIREINMTNYFTVGQNKIVYIGDNFKEWFGEMKAEPKKCKLVYYQLEKDMNDQEILDQRKPEPVTLDEVAWMMGNSDKLLTDGHASIFYLKDVCGVLRAVCVDWGGGGWGVGAGPVGGPDRWRAGRRVFSPSLVDSKTLSHFEPAHNDCSHARLHTEKMLDGDFENIDKAKPVIITFCANCGLKIKKVDIKWK